MTRKLNSCDKTRSFIKHPGFGGKHSHVYYTSCSVTLKFNFNSITILNLICIKFKYFASYEKQLKKDSVISDKLHEQNNQICLFWNFPRVSWHNTFQIGPDTFLISYFIYFFATMFFVEQLNLKSIIIIFKNNLFLKPKFVNKIIKRVVTVFLFNKYMEI